MLSNKQQEIVQQVLNLAFAFDLSKFEEETSISKEELNSMLDKLKVNQGEELDKAKLKIALTTCAKFADSKEIHALTGYSWEEVQEVIGEL